MVDTIHELLYYASTFIDKRQIIMKSFYRQDNIGKAKYTISFHDGVSTHKDGSPFFGIYLFKNKKKLNTLVKKLISEGYKDTTGIISI